MKITQTTEPGAAAVRQNPAAGVEKTIRAEAPGPRPDRRPEADDRAAEEAGYGYGV